MADRYVLGVSIAGLGQSGVVPTADNRLRLSTTSRTLSGGLVQYVSALAAWPRSTQTETEPTEGLTTQGSLEIVVDGLDRPDVTDRQVGHGMLSFFWSMRPQHDLVLTNRVLDISTTIFNVDVMVGGSIPAVGDLLYFGREVMYVTSVGGPPWAVQVVRGVWGSEAQTHDQRDPFGFVNKNSVTVDREVQVYLLDLNTLTESLVWRGVVEGFELIDSTTAICINCRDMLGYLSERKLGVGRMETQVNMHWASSGGEAHLALVPHGDDQLVEYRPLYADNVNLDGSDFAKMITVMVDGVALIMRAFAPLSAPDAPWAYRHAPLSGQAREIDGQTLEFERQTAAVAREILICDAKNPASLFRDAAGSLTDHPANIIRNILVSSGSAVWGGVGHIVGSNGAFDWLPGYWGLNVPDALIDHDAFDLMVNSWPTFGLRARSFYLGADDQEPKAGEVLFDLAQAMSAYIFLTSDAKISIRALRDPGPNGIDAIVGPEELAWENGAELAIEQVPLEITPVYAIEVEIGQQGPGGKPVKSLSAGDLYNSAVHRYRHLAKTDKIETTRIYGDPETYDVSLNEVLLIASVFRWRYVFLMDTLPTYDVRLASSADLVTSGQWVSLSHPSAFNNDLSRGFSGHRCFVMSADFDYETHEQQIRVIDFFPVSCDENFVSPSWKIATVTSDTVFTIEADRFSSSDASFWESATKYEYDLYDGHGALRSTAISRYGTISGTAVTLNKAWNDGAPVTPNVGDIVRIVPYDASKASASWVDEDALYISDSSGFLGSSNDAPAKWDV